LWISALKISSVKVVVGMFIDKQWRILSSNLNAIYMDKDNLYFLKISAYINSSKHREFEQTVKFIFNHLPSSCLSHNLSLDVYITNLYHFYSIWQHEEGMLAFRSSHEFELLKGAFQTLGDYQDTMAGKAADAQLFELNQLDS
jgi:hypothetical protein